MPDYLLIADTERYAGNFERQMCAWVTGQIGECGVGEELAAVAEGDMTPELRDWCEDAVYSKPDDHGCHRPVSISPTPGHGKYNSVEIYLGQKPPDDLLNEMIERIVFFCTEHKPDGAAAGRMGKFSSGPIPLTRVRFVERVVVTTDTPLLVVEA